jgi:hypothetical protein
MPATNEYRLSAKARSNAKLPISAMWGDPGLFFQKQPHQATAEDRLRTR